MEISLTEELIAFLLMLALGIGLGILFDIYRAIRKRIRKWEKLKNFSDIIYWVITGIFIALYIFNLNDGLMRGYMVVAFFFGLFFYFFVWGKWVLNFVDKIIDVFIEIFKLIFKILLTPWAFLYKMLLGPLVLFCDGKIRDIICRFKKVLKTKLEKKRW